MACTRLLRAVAGAWAFAFLLFANSATASPQDLFGLGPQVSAMGGTGAAVGAGFETVFANPALLSASRDRCLTLGFQAARFSLHAEGPNAPGPVHAEPLRGVIIGATVPLPFAGILEHRLTLGTAFFTPSDVVVRANLLHAERPKFPLLSDRSQSVAVQAGLGLDVGYGLRVGAGFSALAGIVGTVEVATAANGQVGTVIEDQLVATYAPILGASYELGEGFVVGITYRGVLEGRLGVTIQVDDLGSLVVPPLNIAGIAQYDPEQIQAEVARKAGDLRIAAGLTLKRWSSYPGAIEPTVLCPPELSDCEALVPPAVHYRDTVVPRLGMAWRLLAAKGVGLQFRGGAFYEPSPVPEQAGEPNDLDNDRLALTFGYGIELDEPMPRLNLDFVFQRHFLLSRTHSKRADIPQAHPGSPYVKTGGAITMAGLMAGARF